MGRRGDVGSGAKSMKVSLNDITVLILVMIILMIILAVTIKITTIILVAQSWSQPHNASLPPSNRAPASLPSSNEVSGLLCSYDFT